MLAAISECKLTPDQRTQWEQTKTLLLFTCPGFHHLLFKLLSAGGDGPKMSTEVPLAATDGQCVIVNPEPFFSLPLPARVFVLAHEVVHNVYNDAHNGYRVRRSGELRYPDGSKLEFDENTWQKAMDYRINAALMNSRIGKMPEGDWKGLYDEKIGTAMEGVYDIYKKIYDPNKQGGKKGKGGKGGGQGFDKVLDPGAGTGQDPNSPQVQRNPGQWATAMAQAQHLEQAKSQGRVSADLQRMFDIYLKPQVPWTEHIHGFFARRLGSGSYSWRRPDRRLIVQDIYAPGRSGFGVNWVTVWGDTSGSIGQRELDTYFAELSGLIEDLRPRRVTVFWCDSQIKFTDDLYDAADLCDVRSRGVGGGGGTSCVPVFDAISSMGLEPPDAFVGLTDGMATFPNKEPSYPCVWACTTEHPIPFGDIVRINAGAAAP